MGKTISVIGRRELWIYLDDDDGIQECKGGNTTPPGGGSSFHIESPPCELLWNASQSETKGDAIASLLRNSVVGWKGIKSGTETFDFDGPESIDLLPFNVQAAIGGWLMTRTVGTDEKKAKHSGNSHTRKRVSPKRTKARVTA